jgi:hypothetical protein
MNTSMKWPKCNAWWSGTFQEFLDSEAETVVGALASRASEKNLPPTSDTMFSWHETYRIMFNAIKHVVEEKPESKGLGILLEYEIPRRASRPDVIILAKETALVIEFKVGSQVFPRAGQIQVAEYVLDLLDYHSASHGMTVIPALVATGASVTTESPDPLRGSLAIRNTAPNDVASLIETIFEDSVALSPHEISAWINAQYRPTPGILESAREVFAGNEVSDIKHAYADNLDLTVSAIRDAIQYARTQKKRLVCFVTGVPGSGKTLTGLSAIHKHASGESEVIGAYLSGNAPLVDVLRYAIARDRHARDSTVSMKQALSESATLIQHIRDFFYSEFARSGAPTENVIVFDEAQRAWNADQMANSGKLKIHRSQPDLALEIMTRCEDWSVIIAIVGEGQEINRGEAGISEWFQSLESYPSWGICAASEMAAEVPAHLNDRLRTDSSLHLKVGTRSPRAQNIADWARQLLDGNFESAAETASAIKNFPMFLTRDLQAARQFLADCATPDRRVGMLASSQDRRLRAYGIERSTAFIRSIRWPEWFVEPAADIRSSYSLEVAASEFECQGLEIDWALVCWGSDLLWKKGKWVSRRFVGKNWQSDKQIDFALNRYRVLLTRARHGMVLWVPENNDSKIPLVNGEDLDKMADLLLASGFQSL